MNRHSERLFHSQFPQARICSCCNCALDHQQRSDLDLQLNHLSCWSAPQQELLKKVYKKVNYEMADGEPGYWNNQKNWKDYDETACLIALSTYHGRERFCSCGLNGYSCGDRLFCLRCCYNLLANPALREFRRAFKEDNECYYIVFSLSHDPDERNRLIFRDLTKSEMEQIEKRGKLSPEETGRYGIPFGGPASDQAVHTLWKIFIDVIHSFTGRGKLFSGAFGGPELSVNFLPLQVLPHTNFIAWSNGLSKEDARRLRLAVREKMRGSRQLPPGIYPSVAIYRIQTADDYKSIIKYIFKPIDIACAYEIASVKVRADVNAMVILNEELDRFMDDLPAVFFRSVHRINRFGFCSASSSNYVGIVTPERHDRRTKDQERRQKKRDEAAEIRKCFPDYQPHRRKKSQKDDDDLRFMRGCYKRLVEEGELPGKQPKRWLRSKRGNNVRKNRQREQLKVVFPKQHGKYEMTV